MQRSMMLVMAAGFLSVWLATDAHAQLFGNRSLGRPLSRRARSGSDLSDAGTVSGTERFLRGNRQRSSFVGTDTRQESNFVGAVQATDGGTVQSTVSGLRVEMGTTSSVNRPRGTPSSSGIYTARLSRSFALATGPNPGVSAALKSRLESTEGIACTGPIEVSVEGRTATLRGTVASERDRRIAQLFALFEPGISDVKNDLIVSSKPIPARKSRRAKRRRSSNR